jgi:hypothetical protein
VVHAAAAKKIVGRAAAITIDQRSQRTRPGRPSSMSFASDINCACEAWPAKNATRKAAGRKSATWTHPSVVLISGGKPGSAIHSAHPMAATAPVPTPVKNATAATTGNAVTNGAASGPSQGASSPRRLIAVATPRATASALPARLRQ